MKLVYYLLIIILLNGCKANYITEFDMPEGFESFDIENFYERKKNEQTYYLENENLIKLDEEGSGYSSFIYPNHKFYRLYKEFYDNGGIKEKGLLFGDVEIGLWEYYDKSGEFEKIINKEEEINPNFNYNDIIAFLHKRKVVNKYKKEKKVKLDANYQNKKWFVRISYDTEEIGYTGQKNGLEHTYSFDYNGKLLKAKENIKIIRGVHID